MSITLTQEQGLYICETVWGFCQGYFGDECEDLEDNPLEYYRHGKREHIPGGNAAWDDIWDDQRWDEFHFRASPAGFEAEWLERGEIVVTIHLGPDGNLLNCLYYGQTLKPSPHLDMEEILGHPLPKAGDRRWESRLPYYSPQVN
jgi:hypothetical protein